MEKKRILIVEDEFIVANDLRLTLEREGYFVEGIASSFKEASQMIDQRAPDLVILDIHIKGKLTGIDVAGLLQKRKIAFVYLSANSDQQVLETAKATEPYGFLVKPFRLKDLMVTLDIAFYRHQHTLESELRNKKQLEKQLELIASIHENETEKLLQMALAIQPHIPFDFISVFRNVTGESTHPDYSLLRIGLEEYQEISTNQLGIITGLKESELKTIRAASPFEEKAGLYNKEEFVTVCRNNPLKRLLAKNFNLESNLEISVGGSSGFSFSISLFSHKNDIYISGHLSLMQSLQGLLLKILNSCSLPVLSTTGKNEKLNAGVKEISHEPVFKGIIGSSPQLLNVLDLARQVASLNTSVLITGESGTGKEKIADCIHHLSDRKNKSFVKINCAALPSTLIESELFGHEKGSFTGALDKKTGKFEQADGGTIFLDEIGEMSVDMQVKLLRVLQEREFERIGGKTTIKIDVRIIAATNRTLEKEVAEGKFRLDLYFRINVFPIHLPPLRERQQDVKEISEYLAKQISNRINKEYHGISSAMMEALQTYSWPGNIRELENTIEQNVILNDGKSPLVLKRPLLNLTRESNKMNERTGSDADVRTMTDIRKLQHNTERDYILSALKKANGRVRGAGGAAELLNLKPTTLESRMAKLGIRKEEYSDNFGGS